MTSQSEVVFTLCITRDADGEYSPELTVSEEADPLDVASMVQDVAQILIGGEEDPAVFTMTVGPAGLQQVGFQVDSELTTDRRDVVLQALADATTTVKEFYSDGNPISHN